MPIDQLIRELQEARERIGGDAIVVIYNDYSAGDGWEPVNGTCEEPENKRFSIF